MPLEKKSMNADNDDEEADCEVPRTGDDSVLLLLLL